MIDHRFDQKEDASPGEPDLAASWFWFGVTVMAALVVTAMFYAVLVHETIVAFDIAGLLIVLAGGLLFIGEE